MIERFAQMPSALRANARWERLGPTAIPAMIVRPESAAAEPAPVVIWMHGRTAHKELDPGRYLRWMRAGIGACAVDLPGHGERFDARLQEPDQSFAVVRQMIDEIDEIAAAISMMNEFDSQYMGIGGMSAGGMATLARLCRPHPFACTSVEATTGSWKHQRHRDMFQNVPQEWIDELNPIDHLASWREIPLQAIHAVGDEWVPIEGQAAFIDALRARYHNPEIIEFIRYDRTGAPGEHIGFGRMSADAKDRQRAFLERWLVDAAA